MSEATHTAARARLTRLLDGLGLEASPPTPCPYLPGRDSRFVALRPNRLTPRLYELFLELNFRRLSDLVESDRANDIKKQALSILHAEAMRSFSRGSKAAADFVEAYLKRANRA